MNDSFVEYIVARKAKPTDSLIKGGSILITVVLILVGLMIPFVLIAGIIGGVLCYFLLPNLNVEYEYLYMNKELQIDKICSKQKRTTIANYELDKMEIFAPVGAYQLDGYKNRKMSVKDYSSGDLKAKRYQMIINENETSCIYLEPNDVMIHHMKNQFPRKVIE
jgi:hypothetical protein